MDTLQFSSKDMTGWDLLGDFDGPEFDGGMAGMLANPELGEYFTEQTA